MLPIEVVRIVSIETMLEGVFMEGFSIKETTCKILDFFVGGVSQTTCEDLSIKVV